MNSLLRQQRLATGTPGVRKVVMAKPGVRARAAALLSASLFLAACAGQTPEPKIRTVEVKVPVVQACIPQTLNLDPVFPDTDAALRATAGPDDLLQLLAAGRLLRIQTLSEWKAALVACR